MILEKNKIRLRPWKMEDAPQLAEIANDKEIADHLRDALPHPYSHDDAVEWLTVFSDQKKLPCFFAIEIDGNLAGSIGMVQKSDVYRLNMEIGYFMGKNYRGKGFMKDAIQLIVDYTFENFEVIRIYAEIFEDNTASAKVLENAGFKLEAKIKNNIIKNGKIKGSLLYSLLKEEYQ